MVINSKDVITTGVNVPVPGPDDPDFVNKLSIDDWINILEDPSAPDREALLEKMPSSVEMVIQGLTKEDRG